MGFLGNASLNDYRYEPLTRQTNFGTLQDPRALLVFYEGQEKDRYSTLFGALKATHVVSQNYTAKYIASIYQTSEQEYFDILAQYRLGEVNNNIGDENLGDVEFSGSGLGAQFRAQHTGHADLDVAGSGDFAVRHTDVASSKAGRLLASVR